jgi:hypothetical protein
MPSAEQFATEFSSFWRACLPMAEGFMRTANLGHERFAPPLRSRTTPERHALISEASLAELRRSRGSGEAMSVSDQSASEARSQLAAIVNGPMSGVDPLTDIERDEAGRLTERIRQFVDRTRPGTVILDPAFPGCGFIDQSRGDLLIDSSLVEIKSVGRSFRLADLRQVLTYAALNKAAGRPPIRTLTLMNPRQGTYLSWPPDLMCYQAAGLPSAEVYESIIRFVSEYEVHPG